MVCSPSSLRHARAPPQRAIGRAQRKLRWSYSKIAMLFDSV
jgi:hypothetical protein